MFSYNNIDRGFKQNGIKYFLASKDMFVRFLCFNYRTFYTYIFYKLRKNPEVSIQSLLNYFIINNFVNKLIIVILRIKEESFYLSLSLNKHSCIYMRVFCLTT
jgi:hypothetical protein